MRTVEFDMRSVGEDDRLAGVKIGCFIRIAPQYIEARGGVQPCQAVFAAVTTHFLRQPGQDGLQDYRFHLC